MGKKGSLNSALSSHQSRQKKKQDAAKAVQVAERKSKKSKGKERESAPRSFTIPFQPTDKILLIGEGNFSFARALVCYPPPSLQFLPPANIVATAYDNEEDCQAKYADAAEIVRVLRERGVEIIFGVDGTKLEKHAALKNRKFDKVVWNFPHAGRGITDQDRNILDNQMLLLGFLRSAAKVLRRGSVPTFQRSRKRKAADDSEAEEDDNDAQDIEGSTNSASRGTVLITLRNVPPYTLWDLPKLAKNPPPLASGKEENPCYVQLRSFVFNRSSWTGYEHRMTKGERAHGEGKTGLGGEDRTWEFYVGDRLT